jgi:ribosomal protein L17
MKCALEMAAVIVEAERLETIRKEEERKKEFEKRLVKFYEKIEKIDTFVENAILKGKGKAELLVDSPFSTEKELGCYCFAELDNRYADRNGGYPYYYTNTLTDNFPLEIYIEYLKSHCYNAEIIPYSFVGYSSTGRTKRTVRCNKIKISI